MREYYSMNENLNCVDHGEVSIEEAYNLIDKYIVGQEELKGIKDGEYVMSKSMFGFNVDKNTFIQIFIYNKEELKEITKNFFENEPEKFKNYFESLIKK